MAGAISRDRGRGRTRSAFSIERLRDRREIRAMLEPERAYAAYAIAQLDPRFFGLSEWYISRGSAGSALVLHSRGGLGQAFFALGDPEALDAALSLHPGARFTSGSMQLEHRPVIERHFLVARPQQMLRMAVTEKRFAPNKAEPVRLHGRDVPLMNRLYALEGGGGGYRPAHVDDGVYYGVFSGHQLVSVAGTHVVSDEEGIAVVGNVFTHPRHRGLGLATATTGAVTGELLERCPLVVLTVEADNHPAVRVYEKLGFESRCSLHETPLVRKDPLGALSFARRIMAGWRGRREGKELVTK